MSGESSFRRDWFWSFLADVASRLGAIVVLTSYMTFLGQEVAGVILVSFSYVMMCWLIVDLGLGLYGARAVALEGADVLTLQAEITAVRLILSIGAACLAVLLVIFLGDGSLMIALSFGAYLVLRGLSLDWFFKGLAKFRLLAFVNISASVVQVAFLPFITEANWSQFGAVPFVLWAAVLSVVGWVASNTSPWNVLKALRPQSLAHVKSSIGFCLTNGVSTVFQQLPIVGLSIVLPASEIAGFGFLHRICMSSIMLFTSLGAAIYPRLVKRAQSSIGEAAKLTPKAMWIIGILALFPAAMVAVGYSVSHIQQTYFSDVSWIACLSLVAFLVLRSMRVAPMRLLFAANLQKQALLVNSTVLMLYIATLLCMHVFDNLTVDAVSVSFVVCELLILSFISKTVRRLQKSSEAAT